MPPSGCSTTTNATTPRPMLVDHFAMKNGINKPSVKTNRLPDCCRRGHLEGPLFMGLALKWNAPTGIGRRPSTICGRTSTRHSLLSRPLTPARKRLPAAIGSLTSTPLVHASRRPTRRPLAQLNIFFTSAPPSNFRGRLHVANASLMKSLLVADAPLSHGRQRLPEYLPVALPPTPLCPACSPDLAATAA